MFAKGRTDIQVEIDLRAEILKRTLNEVPQLIEQMFIEIDAENKKMAKAEAGDEVEIELSIKQSLDEMYRSDDRLFMLELISKAVVVMTDSYCESMLKEIAQVKNINSSKIKGKTKIEKLLRKFVIEPPIDMGTLLDKYWPDFTDFHENRNSIVHENKIKKKEYAINMEYITKNIECVRCLLREVEAIAIEK